MTAPELKPCPFCGVHLEPRTDYARHPLNDCPISPMVVFAKGGEDWNRRADLAAVQPARVRVKPLVWEQCQSTLPRVVFQAKSCFGRYVAWPNGNWKLYGAYGYEQEGDIHTAMAAADADHEARVQSELIPQLISKSADLHDPRDEVIARLLEAAKDAHDALVSAKTFIARKYGSTNPAREDAILSLQSALAAAKAVQHG